MENETLEEAAEKYFDYNIFCDGITDFEKEISIRSYIAGAKWQQERMYSEEEVLKLVDGAFHMYASSHRHDAKEWLVEQFKK
jgi:hypothetical protein